MIVKFDKIGFWYTFNKHIKIGQFLWGIWDEVYVDREKKTQRNFSGEEAYEDGMVSRFSRDGVILSKSWYSKNKKIKVYFYTSDKDCTSVEEKMWLYYHVDNNDLFKEVLLKDGEISVHFF